MLTVRPNPAQAAERIPKVLFGPRSAATKRSFSIEAKQTNIPHRLDGDRGQVREAIHCDCFSILQTFAVHRDEDDYDSHRVPLFCLLKSLARGDGVQEEMASVGHHRHALHKDIWRVSSWLLCIPNR